MKKKGLISVVAAAIISFSQIGSYLSEELSETINKNKNNIYFYIDNLSTFNKLKQFVFNIAIQNNPDQIKNIMLLQLKDIIDTYYIPISSFPETTVNTHKIYKKENYLQILKIFYLLEEQKSKLLNTINNLQNSLYLILSQNKKILSIIHDNNLVKFNNNIKKNITLLNKFKKNIQDIFLFLQKNYFYSLILHYGSKPLMKFKKTYFKSSNLNDFSLNYETKTFFSKHIPKKWDPNITLISKKEFYNTIQKIVKYLNLNLENPNSILEKEKKLKEQIHKAINISF